MSSFKQHLLTTIKYEKRAQKIISIFEKECAIGDYNSYLEHYKKWPDFRFDGWEYDNDQVEVNAECSENEDDEIIIRAVTHGRYGWNNTELITIPMKWMNSEEYDVEIETFAKNIRLEYLRNEVIKKEKAIEKKRLLDLEQLKQLKQKYE